MTINPTDTTGNPLVNGGVINTRTAPTRATQAQAANNLNQINVQATAPQAMSTTAADPANAQRKTAENLQDLRRALEEGNYRTAAHLIQSIVDGTLKTALSNADMDRGLEQAQGHIGNLFKMIGGILQGFPATRSWGDKMIEVSNHAYLTASHIELNTTALNAIDTIIKVDSSGRVINTGQQAVTVAGKTPELTAAALEDATTATGTISVVTPERPNATAGDAATPSTGGGSNTSTPRTGNGVAPAAATRESVNFTNSEMRSASNAVGVRAHERRLSIDATAVGRTIGSIFGNTAGPDGVIKTMSEWDSYERAVRRSNLDASIKTDLLGESRARAFPSPAMNPTGNSNS